MKDEIDIQVATLNDAAEVGRIWSEGLLTSSGRLSPSESEVISAFESRIDQPVGQSVLWVARVNGHIAGWQGLQDFGLTQISRIAQSSTYISGPWHGKGIGQVLLRHAMERARGRGFDVIAGWVKTDNQASLNLVRSLGWNFVGILPRVCIGDPELAYYAYAVPKECK